MVVVDNQHTELKRVGTESALVRWSRWTLIMVMMKAL